MISKDKESKSWWWVTHSVYGSIKEVLKYTISFVFMKTSALDPFERLKGGI